MAVLMRAIIGRLRRFCCAGELMFPLCSITSQATERYQDLMVGKPFGYESTRRSESEAKRIFLAIDNPKEFMGLW